MKNNKTTLVDGVNQDTLTVAQAACILGISPPTLRKLAVKERKITCLKVGSRLKFRLQDLETFRTRSILNAQPE